MGVSDHAAMRERFKSDFYLTAKILCGFGDMTSGLHLPLSRYAQKQVDNGQGNIAILISRMHFKTSLFSVAMPVWLWITNPELRILLAHASSTMSEKVLRLIKGVVYSDIFRHYFPELVPGVHDSRGQRMRKSTSEFDIVHKGNFGEASATAIGVRSTTVGGHYDVLIFDDLIDPTASKSPSEVDNAIDFLDYSDPLFVSKKTGLRFVIGTWWPGGFSEHVLAKRSYKKIVFGCFVDERYRKFLRKAGYPSHDLVDGAPIFPERFSLEDLMNVREEMGPFKWTHQMLNIPAADDLVRFRQDDIMYYEISGDGDEAIVGGNHYPFARMLTTLTVDIATGEGVKTDESAVTVVSYDRKTGLAFVRYAWSGRVLMRGLFDEIVRPFLEFKPSVVGIEDVATQKIFKQFLAHEMTVRNIRMPIKPMPVHGRSKFDRIIEGFQPFVANQQVYFLRSHRKLIHQILTIDTSSRGGRHTIKGSSPDLVDCLAMHVDFWRPPERYRPKRSPIDMIPTVGYNEDGVEKMEEPRYGLRCYT